jgi:hypothetical protein
LQELSQTAGLTPFLRSSHLRSKRFFISFFFAGLAHSREIAFVFPSVLSDQEESTGSFRQFFAGQQMSYYGGPELPEAVERLAATNYKYGVDGRLFGSIRIIFWEIG